MMDQRILFVLLNVRSMLCQIRHGLTKDVEYETDTSKKNSVQGEKWTTLLLKRSTEI